MQIEVISASSKQPDWVRSGFDTYARRLRGSCRMSLTEIPLAKRSRSIPPARLREEEGSRILGAVPKGARIVALDESGRAWSTVELKQRLEAWLQGGQAIALLIGGPDGLAPECLERADERWAVSPLTLPHGLVRILVAEALYRAWSLIEHHPYHRD
ncbi:MAG: 23S rRNA (pseudouridine(1915)-N(3))-methyltransferase RlmH [Gammaproteobacteria bacterium]|jgi:23S rRNA (pseudouridine1915-N3)-methyltransferase